MLALLPKPLLSQLKDFVTSILSRKIEITHCKKRNYFYESAPTFFPSSTQFEFELTCKEKFKDNEESLVLKSNKNKIVDNTQNPYEIRSFLCKRLKKRVPKYYYDKNLSKECWTCLSCTHCTQEQA